MTMQKGKKLSLPGYLDKYRLSPDSSATFTHTCLPDYTVRPTIQGGKFQIPEEHYEDFLKAYNHYLFTENNVHHLTESHLPSFSPILIDLDFRRQINASDNSIKNMKHIYRDKDIQFFIGKYYHYLSRYVNFDDLSEKERYFFVLEKTTCTSEKGQIKDGVHIINPYLVLPYKLLYLVRYQMTLDEEIEQKFKVSNIENPIEDIIDLSIIKTNNWFHHGSSKPKKEPYKLSKIYQVNSPTDIDDVDCGLYPDKKLTFLFSLRYKKIPTEIEDDTKERIEETYESIPFQHKDPSDRVDKNDRNRASKVKNEKKSDIKVGSRKIEVNTTDNDTLEIVKEIIVKCLSSERASNYQSWIRVCWCLFNIDHRLKDHWVMFSQKASNYDDQSTEQVWNQCHTKPYSGRHLHIGSLKKWGREDDPTTYDEVMQATSIAYMRNSVATKAHYHIADLIYSYYNDRYVCVEPSKNIWYRYHGHRWVEDKCGTTLNLKISTEISHAYKLFGRNYAIQSIDNGTEYEKNQSHEKSMVCAELSRKLCDSNFKANVFKECKSRFYVAGFMDKLNAQPHLMHFNNGVYDFDNHEFREGYPEDYISLTTGIDYIEELDYEDYQKQEEIIDFLSKILPDKEVRAYVLRLLSSFLHGANNDQKFHIWTGSGGNGKSKLIGLFQLALGDYSGGMPITVLTKGRGSAESANPVMASMAGKRFAALDEAESDDQIKVGYMKQLTGGDEIVVRTLFGLPFKYRPQFKLVLTCNELPSIPATDDGTWRRIRVVQFPSRFRDNPDPTNPFEFKADHTLDDKISTWPEVFINLLIDVYRNDYLVVGIDEPQQVLKNTNEYKADSDLIEQFLTTWLVEDAEGVLCFDDLFPKFKEWYATSSNTTKKPSRKDFLKKIEKMCGKGIDGKKPKWNGWRIIEDDEEVNKKEDSNQNIDFLPDDDDNSQSV